MCVRLHNQTWILTTEDRIQLGRIGLGLKKLMFDVEGDAQHIHQVIIAAYPVLSECGGYSLMRLAENSRVLIRIAASNDYPILQDILWQAKLPLQMDISFEVAKRCCSPQEVSISMMCIILLIPTLFSVEPEKLCMICNEYFPLSILEKHVANKCCQKQTENDVQSYVNEVSFCMYSYSY